MVNGLKIYSVGCVSTINVLYEFSFKASCRHFLFMVSRERGRECVPLVSSGPSDGFDARRNSRGMFSLFFFCRKELQPRHFSLTLLRAFYQS